MGEAVHFPAVLSFVVVGLAIPAVPVNKGWQGHVRTHYKVQKKNPYVYDVYMVIENTLATNHRQTSKLKHKVDLFRLIFRPHQSKTFQD